MDEWGLTVSANLNGADFSPITDHRPPITAHRSPLTDHGSPITDHRSPKTFRIIREDIVVYFFIAFLTLTPLPLARRNWL